MCGIVGYIGKRSASEVLLAGLRRLEYRGYDSAGLTILSAGKIHNAKKQGKVAILEDVLAKTPIAGTMGIAHTRWATHGEPTDRNAHPHLDCRERISVVHNGIIENYIELKKVLEARGHKFRSSTDTEVVSHLMEEYANSMPMEDAFFTTLKDLRGTFGIVVVSVDEPNRLFAARRGSPLVVGLGHEGSEHFLASDASAILEYTRDVIYLGDDEAVLLSTDETEILSLDRKVRRKNVERITWSLEEIERGNHPHFMLKEMHEQSRVLVDATRGRLDIKNGRAVLGGLRDVDQRLREIERLTIVGCGSAMLAGSVGKYMLEEYAGIRTDVQLASEYRYRKPIIDPVREAVIAVTQSGETIDTLCAMREAKAKGALTLGIVNVVGSTIARESDAGTYMHAGPEIAVASTKAFVAMLTSFALLTLHLGRERGMSQDDGILIARELQMLPGKIERVVAQSDRIKSLAEEYAGFRSMLFLGRNYNAPVACEGALKLKEIAYVHAEGYAGGEMKHGPIALLEPDFPVVAIVTQGCVYEKMMSNVEEVRARRSPVLAIASEGDDNIARLAKDVIYVPSTIEMLSPILNIIPLQLFAYYMAVARGYDPDKPRNLAKSVTVE